MNYSNYMDKVYPYKESIWQREGKGPVWKVGKVLGLRLAYLLYLIGFSANLLDVIGILTSLVALALWLHGPNYPVYWVTGILLYYFCPFFDFVDGALARAVNKTSEIGAILDDVGPDVSRVLIVVFLAERTGNKYLLILGALSAYILVFLVKRTWDNLNLRKKWMWAKKIFRHPMCPISGRVMLGLLPTSFSFFLFDEKHFHFFSFSITIIYILLALIWILLCTFCTHGEKKR